MDIGPDKEVSFAAKAVGSIVLGTFLAVTLVPGLVWLGRTMWGIALG